MLHVVTRAIATAAPLVWTEKESCSMVHKGSVESAMSIQRDILNMSIESTKSKTSQKSNKSERSAKNMATVESRGSVMSNEDNIVKMYTKSMFSIKSKGPAKSNKEVVASAPVDWLSKKNQDDSWTIEDKGSVQSGMTMNTEKGNMSAKSNQSNKSQKSTKSENSAKSMSTGNSKGLVMSNKDDVAAAAPVDLAAKDNKIDPMSEMLEPVDVSLEESIMPGQAKSKRSHKSTESEGSAKSMAMVEPNGLVMSNEDDAASAALVQVDCHRPWQSIYR